MSQLSAPRVPKKRTATTLRPSLSLRNKGKDVDLKQGIHSVAFVMPFQPTEQTIGKIEEIFSRTLTKIEEKAMEKYGIIPDPRLIVQIRRIFEGLNYKTRRKSVSILLTPSGEEVIYLDYTAETAISLNDTVSIADLLGKASHIPDFNVLFIQNDGLKLFEYITNPLSLINAERNYPGYCHVSTPLLRINNEHLSSPGEVKKKAASIISLLNNKNEKPLFLAGNLELVDSFYNSSLNKQIIFRQTCGGNTYSEENLQKMIAEIVLQWNYWYSKFLVGRIILAKSAGKLISHSEAVLSTLRKGTDGLLVIEQKLKDQLDESAVLMGDAKELLKEIEKFIEKGNRIIFVDTALLNNMGRIVLLIQNSPSGPEWKYLENDHETLKKEINSKAWIRHALLF